MIEYFNDMQIDLFDVMYERFMFDKDKPVRVVELFSGIGFQSMGMEFAEVPHEVVGTCEVDKYAILSYAAIHTDYLNIRDTYFKDNEYTKEEMVETLQNKNVGYNFSSGKHTITKSTNIETVRDYFLADKLSNNLGDISLLKGSDFPKDIDIMTYSFPCTDLSKAGQQKGLGKDTRSGLIYEVLRLLHELKEIDNLPKVPIMENVVDLIQVRFVDAWNEIQLGIERLGYTNYTQTLNAKNYGIAQNRDRVFMVSILGEYNYNFPKGFELEHRLKDYLEEEVDEKYYLSDKALNGLKNTTYNSSTLDARTEKDKDPKLVVENNEPMIAASRGRYEDGVVKQKLETGSSETSNTITTVQKDNYLLIPEATTRGYKEAYDGDGFYINRPHQKRVAVQDGMIQTLKTDSSDVGVVVGSYDYGSSDNYMHRKSRLVKKPDTSNTIITSPNVGLAIEKDNDLRIRKLTPTETGRLMGMNDIQISKQQSVVSDSQMYKQHGNGIVAQVIGLIIGMMVYEDENELRETVMRNSHAWLS